MISGCWRLCRNYCPFGREVDADGCPTCRCVGGRGTVPPPPIVGRPLTPAPCRRVLCRNYCRNGRKLDSDGCETCRCNFGNVAEWGLGLKGCRVGRVCVCMCVCVCVCVYVCV